MVCDFRQGSLVVALASMLRARVARTLIEAAVAAFVAGGAMLAAETLPVGNVEGVAHGFLALRTLDGKRLASGDLIQTASGDRVTTRIVFRFDDGSLHDETVVFRQRGRFRLVSDHLVQKGPLFPTALDARVDATSGRVVVRSVDGDGKPKDYDERLRLPPDTANGLTLVLLKNIPRSRTAVSVAMVGTAPKPRLVELQISRRGEEPFELAGSTRRATHYVVHVELGGVAGVVAPLIGKQPEDTHVWILEGEAPAFVKSEGALYVGGPIWRIELASPVWPQ